MRIFGNFKAAERPLAKFKNQNFGTIEFLVVEIMGKVTKNTNFKLFFAKWTTLLRSGVGMDLGSEWTFELSDLTELIFVNRKKRQLCL